MLVLTFALTGGLDTSLEVSQSNSKHYAAGMSQLDLEIRKSFQWTLMKHFHKFGKCGTRGEGVFMKSDSNSKSFPTANSPSVRVQSILFNLDLTHVERSLEYLDNARKNAMAAGGIKSLEVAYGDCSPEPVITSDVLSRLRLSYPGFERIDYAFFNANLGSAAGHNRLLANASTVVTAILNPDVLMFPNALSELIVGLSRPGVGLWEARQIPIEHPKDYDERTGETSWASTACSVAQTRLFKELNGFDSDSFFLYCDDVDFSWRVRLAGYKVIHQCSAMVYHDKRLSHVGGWVPTEAEIYYSAEAALMLTHKYSRSDLTDKYAAEFLRSGNEWQMKAAAAVKLRRETGKMPEPIDLAHRVGQFVNGAYAKHRYPVR